MRNYSQSCLECFVKPMRAAFVAVPLLLGVSSMASAAVIADFEGTGLSEGDTITMEASGLTISGGKLVTEGDPIASFVSFDACGAGDTVCTGAPFDNDFLAPIEFVVGHILKIVFGSPLSQLEFTLGDIDAAEIVEIRAYNSAGLVETIVVTSVDLPNGNPDTGDGHGTLVTFAALDIERIEIENLEPALYGVDNIIIRAPALVINIKPNSDPNSINLCSHGTTPVLFWGSENFDVTRVDVFSLIFSSSSVKTVGRSGKSLCSTEDRGAPNETFPDGIDPTADGHLDLTCHFETFELTDLDDASTEATVSGSACDAPNDFDGCKVGDDGYAAFSATDDVNIVKDCQ